MNPNRQLESFDSWGPAVRLAAAEQTDAGGGDGETEPPRGQGSGRWLWSSISFPGRRIFINDREPQWPPKATPTLKTMDCQDRLSPPRNVPDEKGRLYWTLAMNLVE